MMFDAFVLIRTDVLVDISYPHHWTEDGMFRSRPPKPRSATYWVHTIELAGLKVDLALKLPVG